MRNFIGYLALFVVAIQIFIAKPEPGPNPPPKPPVVVPPEVIVPPVIVPPVEQGKRTIAILYESEDVTSDFAMTINKMREDTEERTDEFADYINSKGHTLYVLDDDTTDADNERAQFITDLLSVDSELPHMYIMESSDGRPLDDKEITFDITVDQIKAFIVENGG